MVADSDLLVGPNLTNVKHRREDSCAGSDVERRGVGGATVERKARPTHGTQMSPNDPVGSVTLIIVVGGIKAGKETAPKTGWALQLCGTVSNPRDKRRYLLLGSMSSSHHMQISQHSQQLAAGVHSQPNFATVCCGQYGCLLSR